MIQEYNTYIQHLRRLQKIESLYALWNYSCNVSNKFNRPLDSVIEFDPKKYNDKSVFKLSVFWWENLVRDTLAYSGRYYSEKNLCSRQQLARAWNYWNTFSWKCTELIHERYWSHKVVHSLLLLAHDQFISQAELYNLYCKYLALYLYPPLKSYIESQLWISIECVFTLWLLYFTLAWSSFVNDKDSQIKWLDINDNDLQQFHKLFSIEIEKISDAIIEEINKADELDLPYAWKWLLVRYPAYIIESNKIICPLPHMFIYRITFWLVYDFVGDGKNDGKFWDLFWSAFESLIWEIINVENDIYKKRIVVEWWKWTGVVDADWFIQEDEALFIIECKTKKLKYKTKSLITDIHPMEEDISIIADALIQSYKSSCAENISPKFKDGDNFKQKYCIVALLEETFMWLFESFDSTEYKGMLDGVITTKLQNMGISKKEFNSNKYLVLSSTEFEVMVQMAGKKSFRELIEWKYSKYSWYFWIQWFISETYPSDMETLRSPFYNKYIKQVSDKIQISL